VTDEKDDKNRKPFLRRCPDNPNTCLILESISDGVFSVDKEWRITSFNRAAEEITGIPRDEAIGRSCWEVFKADACESDCPLRHTEETQMPVIHKSTFITDAGGRRIPISIATAPLYDADGNIIGGVETFRDLSVVEELRRQLKSKSVFGDIVSGSPAMWNVLNMLPDAAASDSTVLIQGETGTGKELLARAIHELSPRKAGPLVTVNCGALPDTLLESELFGYKAGAFTGAHKDKPGRFALAEGGTLFLDEIGDISPPLQVKLLRFMQHRTYEPLGGTESLTADVRILAATHRDLQKLVEEETFRSDLFYRLNVICLYVPPLRERKEDIPLLLDKFIAHFNKLRNKKIQGVMPETLAILMNHDFPGNIRELENFVERAFVLCKEGLIEPQHLPQELIGGVDTGTAKAVGTRETEAQVILETLKRNNFNREAAARELGIHKTTLYRKIHSLNLQLPRKDGRAGRKRRKI